MADLWTVWPAHPDHGAQTTTQQGTITLHSSLGSISITRTDFRNLMALGPPRGAGCLLGRGTGGLLGQCLGGGTLVGMLGSRVWPRQPRALRSGQEARLSTRSALPELRGLEQAPALASL